MTLEFIKLVKGSSAISQVGSLGFFKLSSDNGGSGGGDVSFSRTFGENDWTTIDNISNEIASNNMTAEQVETTYGWKLGDVKSETLSTGEIIELQIIDFNHDDKADGSGKAGLTLMTKNCLATTFSMNSTANANGGWAKCTMRTETLPQIRATLPQDLQNVIKTVKKYSATSPTSSVGTSTSDTLFVLSLIEAIGVEGNTKGEGTMYAYLNNSTTRTKYRDTDGDGVAETVAWWWGRSTYKDDYRRYSAFNGTYTYGGGYWYYNADTAYGLSFALCV